MWEEREQASCTVLSDGKYGGHFPFVVVNIAGFLSVGRVDCVSSSELSSLGSVSSNLSSKHVCT